MLRNSMAAVIRSCELLLLLRFHGLLVALEMEEMSAVFDILVGM